MTLGVALLIALPLSLGKGSTATSNTASFSLTNAAGTATGQATHAAPEAAATASSQPPAPAAPASPAAPPATTAPAKPKVKKATTVAAPAAKDLKIDFEYQINGYYCGPAATRIAASTRIAPPSQDTIAMAMGTTTNGTNSASDTTAELNRLEHTSFYHTTFIPGGSATTAEVATLEKNAVHAISNGYGIVANIVGSVQDSSGGFHEYDGGHYIAVIGYSDNGRSVHIADPAGEGADTYWMSASTLANWMGTRGYSS
ncbi:C39 family peptidase [Rugosimonospora africana]|uniref:C39 family peptidase n=1 Tax=Rugosimonospora africana TaxID=556532 RepID=UPI001944C572|nr:C39 family peptidase [Rugosimonospora africana]